MEYIFKETGFIKDYPKLIQLIQYQPKSLLMVGKLFTTMIIILLHIMSMLLVSKSIIVIVTL